MTEPTAWRNRIVGHGEEAPDQLLANPRNWRVHPAAQQKALASVLDEVGWVQDVIVNRQTGHVVDGHLRVELAISRNEPSVPVVYVDLSENEEAMILATIDPLAAMAGTDKDLLADLLASIEAEGDVLSLLASVGETAGVGAGMKAGLTDPDDVPEAPAEPVSKPGDLWILGDHRVLCGDATKAENVARLIDGTLADCMWTDPPYGVSYVGKTKDAMTIQNDQADGLDALLFAAFASAAKALSPGSPYYIARPAGAQGLCFGDAIRAVGWQLHQELQWVKDTMVLGHSDYHLKHETVMYGWLPGEGRSGRGKHDGSRWYGDHSQVSVFEIPRPQASPEHPTGKPVALAEAHIRNSTPPAGLVYDPFLGSGTTLIACEQLGRRCYGLEIEPRYVDVIVKRWEQFTGKQAVREG